MDNQNVPTDHYLVAGQVAFQMPGDESIQVLALNTLMKLPQGHKINAKALGLAQQGLQMMVHRRTTGQNMAPPKMIDVIILNLNFLGSFLPGEFEEGSILANMDQVPHAQQN
jgi:hypothetical protein